MTLLVNRHRIIVGRQVNSQKQQKLKEGREIIPNEHIKHEPKFPYTHSRYGQWGADKRTSGPAASKSWPQDSETARQRDTHGPMAGAIIKNRDPKIEEGQYGLFAQPGAKNLVPFRTGSVLFATMLFTKPQ